MTINRALLFCDVARASRAPLAALFIWTCLIASLSAAEPRTDADGMVKIPISGLPNDAVPVVRQVSGPSVSIDISNPRVPRFIPPVSGEYVFDVSAERDGAAGLPKRVRVIVSGAAQPPVAILPADARFSVGAETIIDARGSYAPDASPSDPPLDFLWTVPDGLKIIETKGALLKLTSDSAGRWPVSLRVRDSAGRLSPTVRCNVVSIHRPRRPIIFVPSEIRARLPNLPPPSAPSATLALDSGLGGEYRSGETVVLDASGSRSPDGDMFKIRWEQLDGPEKVKTFKAQGDNDSVWTFEAKTPGTYAFRPCSTIGDQISKGEPVIIRISPSDNAPVADAGPDRVAFQNSVVQLDGRASSVSLKTGAFYWSQTAGPVAPRSIIGDQPADQATPRFIFPVCGEYVFSLTVVDADGVRSAPDDVIINVIPENRPPRIETDSIAYCEMGDTLELSARATDPDHDPLNVQWLIVDGPTKTAKGRTLSDVRTYQFKPDAPGHYRFRAVATDTWRARADALVSVYVPPHDNELPAPLISGGRTLLPGGETTLTLDLDPAPGIALFYDWQVISGNAQIKSPNWISSVVLRAVDDAKPNSSVVVSVAISDGARVLKTVTATFRILPAMDAKP